MFCFKIFCYFRTNFTFRKADDILNHDNYRKGITVPKEHILTPDEELTNAISVKNCYLDLFRTLKNILKNEKRNI